MSRLPAPVPVALRLAAGGALAWATAAAMASPDLPSTVRIAAAAVLALTAWRPIAGLLLALALAPAGLLLAPPPLRAAELLIWSFLAAWLLAVWRPLSASRPAPGLILPAVLYGLCLAASWLGYVLGGAAGVDAWRLPMLVARSIGAGHVLYSSPEPETFTLLPALAGLALFAAAATLCSDRRARARAVAIMVSASAAALAVLTAADVIRQWAAVDYGLWYLLRYVEGSRFALHLADLNAAGSQYVLGGLVAIAFVAAERSRRPLWIAAAAVMAPALWISGSRSAALGGLIVGCSVIPLVRRGPAARLAPAPLALLALAVAAAVAGGAVLASPPGEQGTAASALQLRSQFLVTSARMFASAPVFGVGIGHYHERSNEFMPPALRAVYAHENAHNYFAQQFAELGLVGGLLFLWLVAAVLLAGWREARLTAGADAATLGLLAGTAGYLLTCVTGHPLLVPEAALPFWAAFGALAGVAANEPATAGRGHPKILRATAAVVVLLLGVHAIANARRATLTTAQPMERGFYARENAADGTPFVWMTRHGVFYIGPQPGILSIPVQAPALSDTDRPFIVQVEVAGRLAGRYDVTSGGWTTLEIPMRDRSALPFRRVDLRADRLWLHTPSGAPNPGEPRSVMVGETRWTPAGGR